MDIYAQQGLKQKKLKQRSFTPNQLNGLKKNVNNFTNANSGGIADNQLAQKEDLNSSSQNNNIRTQSASNGVVDKFSHITKAGTNSGVPKTNQDNFII